MKRNFSMSRLPFVKIIGVIFAAVGVYFIFRNISFFTETLTQRDWKVGTAVVVSAEPRYESSGVTSRGGKLVYDVVYEYTPDGRTYRGTIYGTADYSKKPGSTIEIKYDPSSPEKSTYILSPSVSNLILGIICSVIFIAVSLMMTGVINLRRLRDAFAANRRRS